MTLAQVMRMTDTEAEATSGKSVGRFAPLTEFGLALAEFVLIANRAT